MKSGLIIYVTGKEPSNWTVDLDDIKNKIDTHVDQVEVITETTGHHDVADAWLSMICRGMQLITCRIGGFTPNGELKLQNRQLRLCG